MSFNILVTSVSIFLSVAAALYASIISFRELRSRGTFFDRRTHENSGVFGGRHLDDVCRAGGVMGGDSEALNEFAADKTVAETTVFGEAVEKIPLETKHLDNYYAQVLTQSKAAFWFSLMFASMGFMVIIAAAMTYSDGKITATVIQGIAGVIIDSVAALFFVQSKRAQVSMSEYFEKLRKDRQKVESRKLCDEISDPKLKDELRTRLALYYAGVEDYEQEAKRIIEAASQPPRSGEF